MQANGNTETHKMVDDFYTIDALFFVDETDTKNLMFHDLLL